MLMSADMMGGWIKKCQTHADVILEWSLSSSKHVLSEMISSHFVPLVATLNSVVRAGLRRTYIRSRFELEVKNRTRAIICRGLYIYYPIFEAKNVYLRSFFRKILSLRMVSIRERFIIKSGL